MDHQYASVERSQNSVTYQYYGLSLVRDYLSSVSLQSSSSYPLPTVFQIRDAIAQWLLERQTLGTIAPVYNNAVSIFALCLKILYPENWPTAFQDLLRMRM